MLRSQGATQLNVYEIKTKERQPIYAFKKNNQTNFFRQPTRLPAGRISRMTEKQKTVPIII